jgi:very-short-patch-repair endonuclease/predicted transcriptional regulator of viral defense system
MPEDRGSNPLRPGEIRAPHTDARIAALAADQHGVVTRSHLLDAGIPSTTIEDRVARGQLLKLHRGVYAVGHRHLRTEGFWLAAVLAIGDRAALSHRDAAALHDLRPCNRSRIEVSTPDDRRATKKIDVHARRLLDVQDVTTVSGIRVTTVSRTLVDVAELLTADRLAKVLNEAERQGKLDLKGIEEAIGRLRGRRGRSAAATRAALGELAAHGTQLTRSPLEDRLLPLLDGHSLPRPRMNLHVEGYEGDAVWPAAQLVVELDGWDGHRTRRAFQHDRTKANALTNAGWTVLRFTHDDLVRRPEIVVAGVRNGLSRASGSVRPPRAAARPA